MSKLVTEQVKELTALLNNKDYNLNMRLTWFCDGKEPGYVKARVLVTYLEQLKAKTDEEARIDELQNLPLHLDYFDECVSDRLAELRGQK